MSDYNRVILSGRLGMDPELKFAQGNGNAILRMRLASGETWKDGNGEKRERTEWSTVIVFGKRGEALSRFLSKGSRLLVEGKLRTREWEQDGAKRYATEVIADDVVLLGDGRRGEREDGGQRQPSNGGGYGGQRQQQAQGAFSDDDYGGWFDGDDVPFSAYDERLA